MVIVRIMGGLGNQLFQYAAGLGLSQRHNVPLKLDLSYYVEFAKTKWARRYGMNHFNIIPSVASEEEIASAKSCEYLKEEHFHYHPEIEQAGPMVYLEGYWQSERYFQEIREELRKQYVFIDKPSKPNRQMAERIERCPSVAFHIRRGDYVTDRHVRQLLGACPWEYYERAVRFLAKKVGKMHFFIFSDDPLWVKKHLELKHPWTLVDINNEDTCYEDMRLMSLCQHHITANSTFSWWGAWLAQNPRKIVVTPEKWMRLQSEKWKTTDLIPEGWHKL